MVSKLFNLLFLTEQLKFRKWKNIARTKKVTKNFFLGISVNIFTKQLNSTNFCTILKIWVFKIKMENNYSL